jgi:cell division protein ZapA
MEEQTITVHIAERPYRLKIRKDEEEIIRRAVIEIDEKLREYSEGFSFQDKQDLLAMALLHFSSNCSRLEHDLAYREEETSIRLERLENILGEAFV